MVLLAGAATDTQQISCLSAGLPGNGDGNEGRGKGGEFFPGHFDTHADFTKK